MQVPPVARDRLDPSASPSLAAEFEKVSPPTSYQQQRLKRCAPQILGQLYDLENLQDRCRHQQAPWNCQKLQIFLSTRSMAPGAFDSRAMQISLTQPCHAS